LGEKYLLYAYETYDELTTYQCSRTTSFKHNNRVEEEMEGLNEIRLPDLRNVKTDIKNK
jgi:hypothetical protein